MGKLHSKHALAPVFQREQIFQWKQMNFFISFFPAFTACFSGSCSSRNPYPKSRLFCCLHIILLWCSHSFKFLIARKRAMFALYAIAGNFLQMSGQAICLWQSPKSLLTVIINDFSSGLSESKQSFSAIFLDHTHQCPGFVFTCRFISHPGPGVVKRGKIMVNIHASGIVAKVLPGNTLHTEHLPENGITDG